MEECLTSVWSPYGVHQSALPSEHAQVDLVATEMAYRILKTMDGDMEETYGLRVQSRGIVVRMERGRRRSSRAWGRRRQASCA